MKAMEKTNQKPNTNKFDVEIRTPAQKYMGDTEESDTTVQDTPHNNDLLQEVYLRAQSQPNVKKDFLPEIQTGRLKNSDQIHNRNFETALEERVYEAARRAIIDSKKERQLELTNQLMDLQSQGFIKSIPKKEGPIRSVEDSLVPRSDDPQSTNKKDPSYRTGFSSNAKTVVSHHIEPFNVETQSTPDVDHKQFGETNAFSETIEQVPNRMGYEDDAPFFGQREVPKQKNMARSVSNSQIRNQDSAGSKSQKDFIIRNVKNMASNPSSKKSTQTGFYIHNSGKNNKYLEVPMANDEIEDTIAFEDTEDWSTPTQIGSQKNNKVTSENQKSILGGVTNVWERVLEKLEEGDLQSAYQEILDSGNILLFYLKY